MVVHIDISDRHRKRLIGYIVELRAMRSFLRGMVKTLELELANPAHIIDIDAIGNPSPSKQLLDKDLSKLEAKLISHAANYGAGKYKLEEIVKGLPTSLDPGDPDPVADVHKALDVLKENGLAIIGVQMSQDAESYGVDVNLDCKVIKGESSVVLEALHQISLKGPMSK